jgi:outer membrane lipoprotein LolB
MNRLCLRACFLRAAMIAAVAWMAGCATPPVAEPQTAAPTQMQRQYHEAIEIGGRLTVRYQQNGADQAVHGSFTWNQARERATINLLSPLGQTIALIEVRPGQATLTMSGQPPRSAADVDSLANEALGWPLPVAGLRRWLQGLATDAQGRPVSASPPGPSAIETSDGWRLTYGAWRDPADLSAANHPRRIDLERQTAQAGNVAIRIVIDSWQPLKG